MELTKLIRKKAFWISFDFFTLFTNINHNKLRFVLQELINFFYKGGLGNYIAVMKVEARCLMIRNTTSTYISLGNRLLGKLNDEGSQKKDFIISINKLFDHHFEIFSKFTAKAKDFHILFKLYTWSKIKNHSLVYALFSCGWLSCLIFNSCGWAD